MNLVIIGSGNGLAPNNLQAITSIIYDLLSISWEQALVKFESEYEYFLSKMYLKCRLQNDGYLFDAQFY